MVKLPHGILEELRQDVIQRQRDEGEASCYVSVDPHSGGVTVLMLTQTPEETHLQQHDVKTLLNGVTTSNLVSTAGLNYLFNETASNRVKQPHRQYLFYFIECPFFILLLYTSSTHLRTSF